MNWLWHDVQEIARVEVPGEIPVFPLPNALIFPFIQLPLYIFEPRYRTMLADCLATHRFMAISLFKPGWEAQAEPIPSYDVAGVGFVRFAQTNEDGTSHIVLAGVVRARIVQYVQLEPYRIAKIDTLKTENRDDTNVLQKNEKLYELFLEQLRYKTGEVDAQGLESLGQLKVPEKFADIAAFYADIDVVEKQTFLEELDLEKRIDRLIKIYKAIPEA